MPSVDRTMPDLDGTHQPCTLCGPHAHQTAAVCDPCLAVRVAEDERRRLAGLAAELPAETRKQEQAAREAQRLEARVSELERREAELKEQLRDAEQHANTMAIDAEVAERAAVAAVEDEQRLRQAEAEEARAEQQALEARLVDASGPARSSNLITLTMTLIHTHTLTVTLNMSLTISLTLALTLTLTQPYRRSRRGH